MRVYLDSSAVLKRVLAEVESADLVATLDKHHAEGAVLVASSLAWIEVARALRSLDAIHLASALMLDADVVPTYDQRLAAACIDGGLAVIEGSVELRAYLAAEELHALTLRY